MDKPLIELRSGEVDEVLNEPPSWLMHWGITIFFAIIFLLLAISWFVKYPDLVKAPLKMVAVNRPKMVNTRMEGRLVRLFVRNGELIQKGQRLADLESTANHEEVLALDTLLSKLVHLISLNQANRVYSFPVPFYFHLGELQKPYQTFQEAFIRSRAINIDGAYSKKRAILQNDLVQLRALHNSIKKQILDAQSDFSLVQDDLSMQDKLLHDKVVSNAEHRQTRSKYISKKQLYEQAQSSLHSNLLLQNQEQQELVELDKTVAEQKNAFLQALNTLKSDLEAWKQRYIIISPTTGKISFLASFQEGQLLESGQELFYIAPLGKDYYGEMYLGHYNFGKVKRGQTIIIKFKGYPYQEFGTVEAKIESIAELPTDTTYLVRVNFPKELVTSTGKRLSFRHGMIADAEIVTENMSLLSRIFNESRRLMS